MLLFEKLELTFFVKSVNPVELYEKAIDVLNVELPKEIKGTTNLLLINTSGQVLEKLQFEGSLIQVRLDNNLSAGPYFIHIENNGKRVMKKVVKF